MGEYATYNGDSIKIGACEDMYYLRYDQRHMVKQEAHSLDPTNCDGLRFRFPFPDEDDMPPGAFDDFRRGLMIYGKELASTVSCSKEHEPAEGAEIVRQRAIDGKLWLIMRCPKCGGLWRTDLDGAMKVCKAIAEQGQARPVQLQLATVALRIIAGYNYTLDDDKPPKPLQFKPPGQPAVQTTATNTATPFGPHQQTFDL